MVIRKAKSPEKIIADLQRTPIDAHNMHMLVVGGEISELYRGRRKMMFLSPDDEGYDAAVKGYLLDLGDCYWYLGGCRYGYELDLQQWSGEWHDEFLRSLRSDDEALMLEELAIQLGDVIDAGKRISVYRKGRYSNPPGQDMMDADFKAMVEKVEGELKSQTDRLLYAITASELLLEQLGLLRGANRQTVLGMNFEKLGERFTDGYSDQEAQDRADEGAEHDLSTVPEAAAAV